LIVPYYIILCTQERISAACRILLNAVGPTTTYRLIKMLVSPAKVTDLSFDEIVVQTTAHFNPKPSPIMKRDEFNTCCQREDESIATYIAKLHKITKHCDYKHVLSDMQWDRLACGIRDKATQRQLLLTAVTSDSSDFQESPADGLSRRLQTKTLHT